MTHERSTIFAEGFHRIHHLYSDRALAALTTIWSWVGDVEARRQRQILRFWIEQGFWGLSWMNRYSPNHFSQVNRNLNGVYYMGRFTPSQASGTTSKAPGQRRASVRRS